MVKKILVGLLIIFVAIQFFRPQKNISTSLSANEISTVHAVPQNVKQILETSCYDCHSNNTKYPWYANIQPVAWYLNDHVIEGKKELNFSEFATYKIRRQYRKLEEIAHEIEDDEMPTQSYKLLHKNAVLDMAQKKVVFEWVNALRDSIKANYPADSLAKPVTNTQKPV
jgi:hypothetical protein